jgi:glycosyltransferase involved in cell wall biosynthesis
VENVLSEKSIRQSVNDYRRAPKMRIVQLTTDLREHDRQYLRVRPGFATFSEALLIGFSRTPGIEVHVVSCIKQPVSSPAKLYDNIFFHSLTVPKSGWLITGYQGCVRAVRRKLREIQPDIVHGQGTERDCAISAVFSGFPSVVTVHGNMRMVAKLHHAKPWSYLGLTAMLESPVLQRAGGVVCNNYYTLGNVRTLNRRTWIIPNAVDPRFFEIELQPVQPPTILCVGLVNPRKNQNGLLEAITPLREEMEFRVRFLGTATPGIGYTEAFQRIVAERPWAEHAGFADRERLKAELAQSTLIVLPTLEDNCPMVVLEAAAAGVPVVASRVGGIPDLVDHGVNGLLFDPHDPGSIRENVRLALNNRSRSRSMAETGKRLAKERFHPVAVAEQHLAMYREVLSSRSYSNADSKRIDIDIGGRASS